MHNCMKYFVPGGGEADAESNDDRSAAPIFCWLSVFACAITAYPPGYLFIFTVCGMLCAYEYSFKQSPASSSNGDDGSPAPSKWSVTYMYAVCVQLIDS